MSETGLKKSRGVKRRDVYVTTVLRSINKAEVTTIETKQATGSTGRGDSELAFSDHSESAVLVDQKMIMAKRRNFQKKRWVLEATREIAVQFTTAFHTYHADEPMEYLENSKPFMTNTLYEKMQRDGRRETLEQSYLII